MKITKSQRPTVERALKWVRQNLHSTKPRAWSCRIIEQQFGRRKIGRWLRSQLLITTKSNWHFGDRSECKEYCVNEQGVKRVCELLNIDLIDIDTALVENIKTRYQQELTTGDFEYANKNHRNHHGLQNIRKDIRAAVLTDAGYEYDYDIICAAANLLYQRALATGMPEKTLIPQYIENRTLIRQHLSEEYQIEPSAIKQFLTGLFQGGYISKWQHSRCFKTFNGNYNHIERLRNDAIVQGLYQEIRDMWNHIIRDMRLNGEFTERRVLGKHKAEIYRQLEELVMCQVKKYLNKHRITYFLIHDGFVTKELIDQSELEIYVRNRTRYQIDLERKVLTNKKKQNKSILLCAVL